MVKPLNGNVEWAVFLIAFWGGLLAAVLYVVFGQVTVRRLKKDPQTKEFLGVDFVNGLKETLIKSQHLR